MTNRDTGAAKKKQTKGRAGGPARRQAGGPTIMPIITLKRYKVFNGMLELRDFTIEDLTHFTKEDRQTVETTLEESQGTFCSVINESSTEKQSKRYYVNDNQAKALKQQVDSYLREEDGSLVSSSASTINLSLELSVAEDYIQRRFPQAKSPQKREECLRSADLNLQACRQEINSHREQVGELNAECLAMEQRVQNLEEDLKNKWLLLRMG